MNEFTPMVSVVMPVYNDENYLHASIESILSQTFRNFELIVIDDGSTDNSAVILDKYRQRDERIVIISHVQNQGIVSSLNHGLQIAAGDYIARMDSDDISLPERFENQVDYLQNHPEVGVLGCDAIFIDSQDRKITHMIHPRSDLSIRWKSLLANIFFHPSVMIRRSILSDQSLVYQSAFKSGQDYALWLEILDHAQGANLDQALIHYRVHPESISSKYKQNQIEIHNQVSLANIKRLYTEFIISPSEHAMLVAAFTGKLDSSENSRRPIIASRYLELWRLFSKRHKGKPGLKALNHEVAVLTAKIGLFPPFQYGWTLTFLSLFKIDSCWLIFFCMEFPKMVWLKRKSLLLKNLRRK